MNTGGEVPRDARGVAIVTGATSGLGRELVIRLTQRGWSVAFCGRRAGLLSRLQEELADNGRNTLAVSGDLTVPGFAESFVHDARSSLGEPRILVNNAAVFGPTGTPLEVSENDLGRTLTTNVMGSLAMIRALVHQRRNSSDFDRGHLAVVNIAGGGIGGKTLESSAFPYVASKAVLYYLSEILATELQHENVSVNCLAPGPMPTGFMEGAEGDAVHANDSRLLAEIEKRKALDGSDSFERITDWIETLTHPSFRSISGRLLSATWDDPALVLELAVSSDYFRLRRIDGELFAPK